MHLVSTWVFIDRFLSKYAPRFRISSSTVILCSPTKMLVKLIFASCWYEPMRMHSVSSNCWKCGICGHSAKECQSYSTMATQDQTYKGQANIQTPEPTRYPTPMSPVRPSAFALQISAITRILGIN